MLLLSPAVTTQHCRACDGERCEMRAYHPYETPALTQRDGTGPPSDWTQVEGAALRLSIAQLESDYNHDSDETTLRVESEGVNHCGQPTQIRARARVCAYVCACAFVCAYVCVRQANHLLIGE